MTQRRPPGPRALAALTVLIAVAVTLAVLELGLRIQRGALGSLSDPGGGIRMIGERYPGSPHPRLGFVPTPGSASDNAWSTTVTITPDGLRSNGAQPPTSGAPILAVGDSFTFGDEVGDSETWPAQLETMLGRPVLNGGVFGYGFDQITLRSEELLERFPEVDTLIVSLIPDDVLRCEYAYRYAWKPYFEIENGALVLRNVPVPPPHRGPPEEAGWRRALRWSLLADFSMRRLDPEGWPLPDSLRVHRQGVEVARLLVDRLADAAERRGHRLILLLEWLPWADPAPADPVLERAAERGIDVLRVESRLRTAIANRPGGVSRLFSLRELPDGRVGLGHMTALGNAIVAAFVADHLSPGSSGADRMDVLLGGGHLDEDPDDG